MLRECTLKPGPIQYVLAIDAGGTKCDALLAGADGTLLERCRLHDWATGGRHPEIICRAIQQVLQRRAPAGLRLVADGGKKSIRFLPKQWWNLAQHVRCSEPLSALRAAGYSFGLVVIAGTGSRVAVRTRAGREASVDALGPVLGDGGSGYYIGREALRAIAREIQLRRPATRLRQRVLRACGCRNLPELVRFSLQPRDRSLLASLAKIVDAEARAGDRLARRLLRDGATMMAATIRDLVAQLGIARAELPLVGAGSVAVHSDIYWRELCRQVRVILPRCQPVRVPLPPVAGLAAQGLKNAAAVAKLFATLKKEKNYDSDKIPHRRAHSVDAHRKLPAPRDRTRR